ncbi:MAG: hypothetical protein LC802_24365 [Acidobacteria bacterium]|nr:hypothetical protein [Acidobacteriota bacterium]
MQSIIRTKDEVAFGLAHRYVYGLNIFFSNGVKIAIGSDPRVIFLKTLIASNACSAHTGNLLDVADTPRELFGLPEGEHAYSLSRTGVYDGTFYDVEKWDTFPACFFPRVKESFLEVRTLYGEPGIEGMLSWDALALYVGAAEEATERMQRLIQQPFPGHENWLRQVSSLHQLIILTGDDGWDFYAYTQDASNFALLTPAITKVVEAIESHDWYQAHASSLVWDDKDGMCLLLPALLREQ